MIADPTARPGGSALTYQRSTWHRKASRPILLWMVAILVVVLFQRWIPEFRWLLVHMVTLGLITNSILVWSQFFAEALLKNRLDDAFRHRQLWRMRVLNLGIVGTVVGLQFARWPVTLIGAALVSAALVWHALALLSQVRSSISSRFRDTVVFYAVASLLMPVGAGYGVALAAGLADPWHGRLLLAHETMNLLGFVALTIVGTLITLWPTMLRTRMATEAERPGYLGLVGMLTGLALVQIGAWVGMDLLVGVGLALYLAAVLVAFVPLVKEAIAAPPVSFATLSVGAGGVWLVGILVALTVTVFAGDLTTEAIAPFTVPFVAGFLLQILFGAMSYLMPTSMRGGPVAVRAGTLEMNRGAGFRVALVNAALLLHVLPTGATMQRVSLVVAGIGLGLFVPAMLRSVVAQVRERRAADAAKAEAEAARESGEGVPAPAPQQPQERQRPQEKLSPAAVDGTHEKRGIGALAGLVAVLLVTTGTILVTPGGVGAGAAAGGARDSGAIESGEAGSGGAGGGLNSAAAVEPTGETTTVEVAAIDMDYSPAVIEVPLGDELVIELTNTDPTNVHDLELAGGVTSERLAPGETDTIEAGVISAPVAGWCTVPGHRAMGMELEIVPVDAGGEPVGAESEPTGDAAAGDDADGTGPAAGAADGTDGPPLDLSAAPGADHARRDAALAATPAATTHRISLDVTERDQEVAPGLLMQSWTYNGRVMGPTIRAQVGDTIEVTLTNSGSMGHSVDFHAGTVSPDENMRTIPPGESLVYTFEAVRSGIWMYHCSTMPMSTHVAAGMFGAVIVDPPNLDEVDREYLLVQSEAYLDASAGTDAPMPVAEEAIAAEDPTAMLWNGHATQYVAEPLEARVGERVRIWVLAAGPSRGTSFHVVGSQFDTVFKEGAYLLEPGNAEQGGAQALDLAPAQGGFVEMEFAEPGTYTFVNHSFVDMERGARGLVTVTG